MFIRYGAEGSGTAACPSPGSQEEGLSVHETRQRVREMLGKKLKWQLVPIRLDLETFETLKRKAPNGDVKRLIQETIEKLIQPHDNMK